MSAASIVIGDFLSKFRTRDRPQAKPERAAEFSESTRGAFVFPVVQASTVSAEAPIEIPAAITGGDPQIINPMET